jgi:hypothetical protein
VQHLDLWLFLGNLAGDRDVLVVGVNQLDAHLAEQTVNIAANGLVHGLVALVVGGFGRVVLVVVEFVLVVDLDVAAAQIALQAKLSEVGREADVLGKVGVCATKHVCVSLRLWRIMVE